MSLRDQIVMWCMTISVVGLMVGVPVWIVLRGLPTFLLRL